MKTTIHISRSIASSFTLLDILIDCPLFKSLTGGDLAQCNGVAQLRLDSLVIIA